MNNLDRESVRRKLRLPTSNVDTTINELRFKKKGDGTVLRKFNSLSADEDEGVVERRITEAIEDTRGKPITKSSEIGATCKVCRRTIRRGEEEVACDGRCGEILCRGCYQKQGSHVLHGRIFCRWDYWWTKLWWRWVSPSLRRADYKSQEEKAVPNETRKLVNYEKPRGIYKRSF